MWAFYSNFLNKPHVLQKIIADAGCATKSCLPLLSPPHPFPYLLFVKSSNASTILRRLFRPELTGVEEEEGDIELTVEEEEGDCELTVEEEEGDCELTVLTAPSLSLSSETPRFMAVLCQ